MHKEFIVTSHNSVHSYLDSIEIREITPFGPQYINFQNLIFICELYHKCANCALIWGLKGGISINADHEHFIYSRIYSVQNDFNLNEF